ncbi:MAG TPA: M28 family peptidase [Chitinophagaceae bacterium]|nr:M28 family peptidase [Chitinophagaceae bacterium]
MKKTFLLYCCFAAIAASAQTNNEAAQKFADIINPTALKEKLSVIAGAEMEGRETATPGQKRAAAYIEDQFKKFGLKPGNGNSYQQMYPVYQDELVDKKFQVNGKTFEWDKDYTFSLQNLPDGDWIYNNILFAGYGLVDDAKKINDYANIDVKGKMVMVLDGLPDNYKVPQTQGRRGFGGPGSAYAKAMSARIKGAVGIIIISKDFPKKTPSSTKGNMYLTKQATANSFLNISVSEEIASAILGNTATISSDQLKETVKAVYVSEIKIVAHKTTGNLESSNVIGILPGTDKKDEYVFLTGHYDHLGKRDGVIYYGADDDGSGTTSVLQMAEAFTTAARKGYKPRRTMVFMTVSGEEKGLWGSQYYSEHPIFPLDKTTVDLNTDMDGRVDTERKLPDTLNYIYVIGHDKLSSELPIINEAVNNKYTKLTLDYKFDDPNDKERIYYRSDHYNFARKGVPVLFFYDGMLLADYHKPTDTVDKINFDLMSKRVQLVYYTAWDMANRDNMLKRDTPLNMPSR